MAEDRPERPGAGNVPAEVLMPLLERITRQALDEDYQQAAARSASGAAVAGRGSRRPSRVAAAVVAVFGVLTTTVALQTSRNADVDSASRETLIQRVEARSDAREAQEQRIVELRSGVASLERQVGRTTDAQQARELDERRLQVSAGFTAVTGEGIRVRVTEPTPESAVGDADLADLVNALWQAGAEAVAVNDQRVTARTGIRFSSFAITINKQPVAAPYDIEAIGDTRTMAARLIETRSGQDFAASAAFYGFEYEVEGNVESLTLPAAPMTLSTLQRVEMATADDSSGDIGDNGGGGS